MDGKPHLWGHAITSYYISGFYTSAKLYCLVFAQGCEQLAQRRHAVLPDSKLNPQGGTTA